MSKEKEKYLLTGLSEEWNSGNRSIYETVKEHLGASNRNFLK